jgi:hypothetical protein
VNRARALLRDTAAPPPSCSRRLLSNLSHLQIAHVRRGETPLSPPPPPRSRRRRSSSTSLGTSRRWPPATYVRGPAGIYTLCALLPPPFPWRTSPAASVANRYRGNEGRPAYTSTFSVKPSIRELRSTVNGWNIYPLRNHHATEPASRTEPSIETIAHSGIAINCAREWARIQIALRSWNIHPLCNRLVGNCDRLRARVGPNPTAPAPDRC